MRATLIVLLALPLLAFHCNSGGFSLGFGWSGQATGPGPPPMVPLGIPMFDRGLPDLVEPIGDPGAPPPTPEPIDIPEAPEPAELYTPPEAPYELPESPPSPEPVAPVPV
jgi:hypothetical protein